MPKAFRAGRGSDFTISKFTVIIDTREQLPWEFRCFKGDAPYTERPLIIPTERHALKTGDYSVKGLEDRITIERKSLADLYGTLGQGRDRFIRELERMQTYEFAALICESDWPAICSNPPSHSNLHPKTVFRSLLAFAQRYGVHFYPCPTPTFAERVAYRVLERFWIDRQPGGHFYVSEGSE